MERVEGRNTKVDIDGSGKAAYSVDWVCPHCGALNATFGFNSHEELMSHDFEIDEACESCGEVATVECRDAVYDNICNR